MPKIGIIGGSGLYDIDGVENREWVKIDTPYGEPSDQFLTATIEGIDVVFLPRHGRGHKILPSEINYRANIYGMKALGVDKIVAVSACGSLREELKPLDFVVPLQFVDRTNQARKNTFFDKGIVAHVSLADPVCLNLTKIIEDSVRKHGITVHYGGTYVNMEGPQFSTRAESNLFRSWGMDIIGMTTMMEARLAREAEICFAMLAAVTDYDCWHEEEDDVSTMSVLDVLNKNVENSKKIVKDVILALGKEGPCECNDALQYAVFADMKTLDQEVKDQMGVIINKYT